MSRPTKTFRLSLFAAAALVASSFSPALAKKVAPLGAPSKAITPEIVDAIAEEMDRALAKLELPGAPKPYHISYKITEAEVNDAVASLGHVTNQKARHFVNLECRVRVKVDNLDNGNFVVPRAEQIDGSAGISLALEATPRIARRAAWLVTDTAYKEALVQLRAKLDARTAGGVGQTSIPSWTDEPAVVADEQVLVAPLESLDDIVGRAEKISAVFRGNPDVRDSHVAFTSYLERRWYLTSEGTSATDTRRASGVIIVASGQAQDGQAIDQYYAKYGHTAADLPGNDDLEKEAKALGGNVVALAKAPVIDRYTGPVLFEGDGAAGVVRYSLAPNLGGTPLPEGLSAQEAKLFGGALTDKVGLKVVAPSMSIVDDPTAAFSVDKAVIGGYKTDDEGVAAQKVDVVKDGFLKTLLTTRTPASATARSNGHARRTTKGGAFHGSATNLTLTMKGGLAAPALKKKLLAEVKAAGLPFGLLIRRLDDSAVTASREWSRRELIQVIVNADLTLPPPAILAYRVYPSGKEELVRGVQLAEIPVRAWKDVAAGGKTMTVFNFLASPDGYIESKVGGVDEGFVPSSGIESSVATPDLLFKELDVVPSTVGLRARPMIPAPPPGK